MTDKHSENLESSFGEEGLTIMRKMIEKRKQIKADFISGKITKETYARLLVGTKTSIFDMGRIYGSMGTGLDGHGNGTLTSECRTKPKNSPLTTWDEVLSNAPPEIWLSIEPALVDMSTAENFAQEIISDIKQQYGDSIKVSLQCGFPNLKFITDVHVLILVFEDFVQVIKARGTETAGKVIPKNTP